MDRPRCTRCRNPIRNQNGVRDSQDAWFHPDCWAEVRDSRQQKYEQSVQQAGLTALLAPYLMPTIPHQAGSDRVEYESA